MYAKKFTSFWQVFKKESWFLFLRDGLEVDSKPGGQCQDVRKYANVRTNAQTDGQPANIMPQSEPTVRAQACEQTDVLREQSVAMRAHG